MNDQERISRIRCLLDRFYDGTATPDEISELSALFASGEIPADLEAERRAFEMMANPDIDGIDIPDGLEESLVEIMTEPRPSLWARFRPWSIGAAAAAAILALVMVTRTVDDKQSLSVGPFVTEVDDSARVSTPDTITVHPLEVVRPEPKPLVAERKATKPKKAVKVTKPIAIPDDPYIEITDPVEAARIATDLLCMVSETMRTPIDKTEEITTSKIASVQTVLSKFQ